MNKHQTTTPPAWMYRVVRDAFAEMATEADQVERARVYRLEDFTEMPALQAAVRAIGLAIERGHVVEAETETPLSGVGVEGLVEALIDATMEYAWWVQIDVRHEDKVVAAHDKRAAARTALLAEIRPRGGGEDQSASPSGSGSRASIEPASAGSPASGGVDPSRITLEGIVNLLWELSQDSDCEPADVTIFREAWSRLQAYRPEARRIIFAAHGHWSAWSEEELDSDPSDPLVGRTTEWFVGFWRTGEPEADTYVRTGSGRSAERIARELAADLNEMVSLVARARDEQPKAENPKGLNPQGASPVTEGEAPVSKAHPPTAPTHPRGEDTRSVRGATFHGRLTEGCLSAVQPCGHQRNDPNSICALCQQSWDRYAKRPSQGETGR